MRQKLTDQVTVPAAPWGGAAGLAGGPIVTVDHPASSTLTQKQLGWHPAWPALIPDLDEGHYFGG